MEGGKGRSGLVGGRLRLTGVVRICDLRFLSNPLGVLFFLSRVIFVVRVLDTFVFSGYDVMDGNTNTNFIPPSWGKKDRVRYQKFLLTCALIKSMD